MNKQVIKFLLICLKGCQCILGVIIAVCMVCVSCSSDIIEFIQSYLKKKL